MSSNDLSLPRVTGLGPKALALTDVIAVLLLVSWVAVFLRTYVRAYMIRYFGPDDWLMVSTVVGTMNHCMYIAVDCGTSCRPSLQRDVHASSLVWLSKE